MKTDVVIPKLGMTMTHGKVVEWKVGEGEWVDESQIVVVIETEKVTYEVEAQDSGYLHILAGPGDSAEVAEAIGELYTTKEELPDPVAATGASSGKIPGTKPAGKPAPAVQAGGSAPKKRPKGIRITPTARKLAEAHNLDYTVIKGSGTSGRINRADVEQALAAGPAAVAASAAVSFDGEIIDGKRVKDELPLTGMRAAVAEHMHHSLQVSAQLTTMGEMDATELIRMRNTLVAKEAVLGTRITYTDILAYVVTQVLKAVPILNSSIIGNKIKLWEDINLGIAVSLPEEQYDAGLIVPVVKNAERMSLTEISIKIKELREKAISGRLALDDITGGTFTISNTGGFGKGYTYNTPVISQPQSAILGVGAIVDRPLVVNGEIVVRPVMNWNLTFDHRAINGAPVGKFLAILNDYIENPYLLMA
ncbi:2-oxo acid dehydrogenase subunit E2 [bacterium]|nr:2-oxo acid dehydrogenase subunit E2 [bacterium]